MRAILCLSALLALGGVSAAQADANAVLDHHVAMMKKGDLQGVLADYADNAVIITPHGVAPGQKAQAGSDVFVGKASYTHLFATLTDKDHVPGNKTMQTRYEPMGNDTTLMHWVQNKGTANEVAGTDVWVIKDGKVAFQSVLIEPAKK